MDRFFLEEPPQIRETDTVRSVMLDVFVALLPAYIWGIYIFGLRALTIGVLSIGFSLLFEALYQKLTRQPVDLSDSSALITGFLIAMCLPVSVSLWLVPIASFFAVVVVKRLFCQILKIHANYALSARVVLYFAFFSQISRHTLPFAKFSPVALSVDPAVLEQNLTDGSAVAESLRTGVFQEGVLSQIFTGTLPGGIGEVSAILLLAGLLYLLVRRVVTWHIPLCFLGTVALFEILFPGGAGLASGLLSGLFTGGVVFAAVIFATDYSTSPVTSVGKAVYGVICGVLTFLFRRFLSPAEGAKIAVLLAGLGARYLDRIFIPRSYGSKRDWKNILSFLPVKKQ